MVEQLKEIATRLEEDPSVAAAYVHGSVAKGTARAESDLDIALLCHPGQAMDAMELLMLSQELASLSNRELHLSVLSHDNLIFLREVAEHGELLFSKDLFFSDMFICTGLSLAAKLTEDSREVIDAYTA